MENFPKEPYKLHDGEHAKEFAEMIMFKDYLYLQRVVNFSKKNSHKYYSAISHIEWLMRQGENRKAKIICPQCHEKNITYFSIYSSGNDSTASLSYTACDDCVKELGDFGGKSRIFPIKFSSFLHLNGNKKIATELFKKIFKLEGKLTAKKAFQFFSE